MDIRKLQKTGGASLIVTLPSKWVKSFHLKDKDNVQMTQENGILLIQPLSYKKTLLQSFLTINTFSLTTLTRELIAHYVSGVDEIIISGKQITPEQRTKIRSVCTLLIGFELLDESAEKVVLKNVFDVAKFSMAQKIESMFVITKGMFEDAYKALLEHDETLATDVINRDVEIDKFQFAVTRQLYAFIRKNISEDEAGLTEIDFLFFQNIATQLERIADHSVKIARSIAQADISGTPVRISSSLVRTLAQLLDDSGKMVKNLDKEKAHEILDSSTHLEEEIFSKKTRKHKDSLIWDFLEDSLDRTRGYIMNMAEITIDQAVLKKG